jgi:hypothetical protein
MSSATPIASVSNHRTERATGREWVITSIQRLRALFAEVSKSCHNVDHAGDYLVGPLYTDISIGYISRLKRHTFKLMVM